jgi:hypothetical protein
MSDFRLDGEASVVYSIETGPQGPPGKDGSPETIYERLDDRVSEEHIVYIGEAIFGSDEEEAVWRIYKADFTSVATKRWAGGNANFVNKWSERLSLIY